LIFTGQARRPWCLGLLGAERGIPRGRLWVKPTRTHTSKLGRVPAHPKGAAWYARSAHEKKTKGTKVFALAVNQDTGLVEVPFGTPLRDIIYEIGGGIPDGKQFKAVQSGGPSGGVIPQHLDTPVEYETLQKLGSIMGSGGMVIMDEDSCMVDVARSSSSLRDESCGKCPPCRVGTKQMLNRWRKSPVARQLADLDKLEIFAPCVRDASLCGLGQTAPNPVLTTLKYFRHEYEQHLANTVAWPACAAICSSRRAKTPAVEHEHPRLPPVVEGDR